MRSTTALLHLAVCLSSITTMASAWPGWLPELDALVVRADDDDKGTTTAAEETTATGTDRPAETTNDSGSNTAEPEETSTESETGKKKDKATKTKSSEHTSTSFPPDSPPGGVSMITPATTAIATPLYKVGNNVDLAWNYTSLLGPPTAVDVLISCSEASKTWTITSNMTFETSVSLIWNTNDTHPTDVNLLSEMYTLIIKDSEADITDVPQPGYLGAYSGFTFGLYTPQAYVPYDEWECTGCNAGSSDMDRRALGFAVTMSLITVFSFTWFVTGLGLH